MQKRRKSGATSEEFGLYALQQRKGLRRAPILVEVIVDIERLTMEVDTGAGVSIVSECTWNTLFPSIYH